MSKTGILTAMQRGLKAGPGHVLMVFGLFLSLFASLLLGASSPRVVAFGTEPIATLSNQYRRDAGLPDYTMNEQLTRSAQAKADDMASKLYFAHESPEGRTPWSFFDDVQYIYKSAGENLALTNESPQSVVDGWYNSPSHRANLLNTSFTEVGYGISYLSSFTYKNQTYQNVWLVAAHYALPVGLSVTSQTNKTLPLGTSTATTSQADRGPNTHAPEPLVQTSPQASSAGTTMVTLTIVLSGALVVVGVVVEIRRLALHRRTLPRFHP